MLNQKHNVFKGQKSKSKILLIILSIFGLAFSYSCSCRNPNKPPSGGGNFAPKANPSSQLSLIASEDGTTKTQVAISFYEENSHNIKSAKATKIVDDKGNDITDKATYVFSDGKFSFINQSDLQGILTGMDSTSEPATNTLTVTFEITTDSTEVLNTTATVDVNVYLVKTQKFGDDATLLKDLIISLGDEIGGNNREVLFKFQDAGNKATVSSLELENSKSGSGDCDAASFVSGVCDDMKKKENYKYFDNVTYSDPTGIGTTVLNVKYSFTPKNIYDMSLLDYSLKLDIKSGQWISGK